MLDVFEVSNFSGALHSCTRPLHIKLVNLASFYNDAEVGRFQIKEFVVPLLGELENCGPLRLDLIACLAKATPLIGAIATLGVACHLSPLRLLVPLSALFGLLRALHVDLRTSFFFLEARIQLLLVDSLRHGLLVTSAEVSFVVIACLLLFNIGELIVHSGSDKT